VQVRYCVWNGSGKAWVDTSFNNRGGFKVTSINDRFLPGIHIALQQMVAGERRRLWLPQHMALKGKDGKPRGTVVVDLALLNFHRVGSEAGPGLNGPP
jgi:FKBP-type peptidyl-prolyl cis-trans isomerase